MKKKVSITQFIDVEVDETKFTPEFMEEFRRHFYPFKTIDEHITHIASLEARGLLMPSTEGYGDIDELGIKARVTCGQGSIEL